MKIVNYQFPKSSFLSVEKDLEIITNRIFKNTRLQRLLYYTTPDALSKKDLTEEQRLELFEKNIKIVPKLVIDNEVLNYIMIGFANFVPNPENPEFRNNFISFDIICHFDQWKLKDSFALRPYRIAAELDTMLDHQHLTGIGELNFVSANHVVIDDEYAGISLIYNTIHGEEDKKGQPNPANNKQFEEEFNQIFNS